MAEAVQAATVDKMVEMDQIHYLAQLLPQQAVVAVEIEVTEAATAVLVKLEVQVVVLELQVVRVV